VTLKRQECNTSSQVFFIPGFRYGCGPAEPGHSRQVSTDNCFIHNKHSSFSGWEGSIGLSFWTEQS